jgi:hypothetical protein
MAFYTPKPLAAMTMMMAIPAMAMVRMSNRNHDLCTGCWNQRHKEHKGEKSKR